MLSDTPRRHCSMCSDPLFFAYPTQPCWLSWGHAQGKLRQGNWVAANWYIYVSDSRSPRSGDNKITSHHCPFSFLRGRPCYLSTRQRRRQSPPTPSAAFCSLVVMESLPEGRTKRKQPPTKPPNDRPMKQAKQETWRQSGEHNPSSPVNGNYNGDWARPVNDGMTELKHVASKADTV